MTTTNQLISINCKLILAKPLKFLKLILGEYRQAGYIKLLQPNYSIRVLVLISSMY